jgi:N-acetyl-gamma-glutamylphosphate reductase
MDAFPKFIIGASGITGVELLQIIPADPTNIGEIIKIVTQVIVGIATLWAMFRKKKN